MRLARASSVRAMGKCGRPGRFRRVAQLPRAEVQAEVQVEVPLVVQAQVMIPVAAQSEGCKILIWLQ